MAVFYIGKSLVFTNSDFIISISSVQIFIALHVDSSGDDEHGKMGDDMSWNHFYPLKGFF